MSPLTLPVCFSYANLETKQIAVLSLEKAAIALFLHIFARLPIFSGRHTNVFIKHGVEMANAAESQVIRDISDGSGAVGQQVLRFADAAFHDVLHGRHAKFVFKHMR